MPQAVYAFRHTCSAVCLVDLQAHLVPYLHVRICTCAGRTGESFLQLWSLIMSRTRRASSLAEHRGKWVARGESYVRETLCDLGHKFANGGKRNINVLIGRHLTIVDMNDEDDASVVLPLMQVNFTKAIPLLGQTCTPLRADFIRWATDVLSFFGDLDIEFNVPFLSQVTFYTRNEPMLMVRETLTKMERAKKSRGYFAFAVDVDAIREDLEHACRDL